MSEIAFRVDGPPRTWQRARTNKGRHFDSPKQKRAKIEIFHAGRAALIRSGVKTFVGAVGLEVVAVYPRPKQRPPWTDAETWKAGGRIYKPTRGDLDNVAKLIADSIQPKKGARLLPGHVLKDDAQVARFIATKQIAAVGEEAHTMVRVWSL